MLEILYCSRCSATLPSAHLAESGWVIIAGKPWCPEHAAARRDRDGIDQGDAAAPEVELRDYSGAMNPWDGDTAEMEPSGEHEL